jgi:hypothetical protein
MRHLPQLPLSARRTHDFELDRFISVRDQRCILTTPFWKMTTRKLSYLA